LGVINDWDDLFTFLVVGAGFFDVSDLIKTVIRDQIMTV